MLKITSPLERTLYETLSKYGNIDVIVAYSGGVDSQVLLYALAQLRQNKQLVNTITVCHVNHGLSDNALYWQRFAEKECSKLSLMLTVKNVDVKVQAQHSLEALARDARYDALKSLNDKPSLVLTGHHSNDQSETFLLALKRGAGLKGLSAMAVESKLGEHLLVRPLLKTSRQDIVDYAKQHHLDWIEDESNTDTSFDRNFIRKEVMPLLTQRWPGFSKTINRSASHCLAGQELLDELAEQDLAATKASETSLNITVLTSLSSARFNNLIRYFLTQHNCLMPSTEQVKQLKVQLQASDDKTPMVKVGAHYFRRFKDAIYLTPDYDDVSCWHIEVDLSTGVNSLTLPDKLGELFFSSTIVNESNSTAVLLPKDGQRITVRFSHDNPKCLPDYRQHSRSVKKVLQELNIAPWQRKRIAFLYYDNELVSAIGYFVCQPFIAAPNQPSLFLSLKNYLPVPSNIV